MTKRQPIPFPRIFREISCGKSLRKVLKGKGMPGMHRFFDALERQPETRERYARARRQGIEHHIDGLVDLADTATEENSRAIQLRVDTRKWIASKILPRIYGDYQRLDIRAAIGSDLGPRLRRAREREIQAVKASPALPALPAPAAVVVEPIPEQPALSAEERVEILAGYGLAE